MDQQFDYPMVGTQTLQGLREEIRETVAVSRLTLWMSRLWRWGQNPNSRLRTR